MSKDVLKERGNAFEAQYFNKLSEEKAKALKEKIQIDQAKNELKTQTGIEDDAIIDALFEHGITSSQLSALTLFPIAYVAWADGEIDEKEKQAISKACQECGIEAASPSMDLIHSWLEAPLDSSLFSLWKGWIQSVFDHMEEEHAKGLALNIKNKSKAVANASRSFLGLGPKISSKEEVALQEIDQALQC